MNSIVQKVKDNSRKKLQCAILVRMTINRQQLEEQLALIGISDLELDPLYVDLTMDK